MTKSRHFLPDTPIYIEFWTIAQEPEEFSPIFQEMLWSEHCVVKYSMAQKLRKNPAV